MRGSFGINVRIRGENDMVYGLAFENQTRYATGMHGKERICAKKY